VSERETTQRRASRSTSARPAAAPGGSAAGETALTYEEARDELVEVVHQLETGGTTLEDSLRLWERGEELATICQSWLDGARARLEAARSDAPADEVEDLDRDSG
jgi:exodeoxyribonuclease VII small subunit